MFSDEAKRYVAAGLEQRSIARNEREREEKLEAYESDMISFCNKHSADSKKTREKKEKREINRAMRAEKRAAMQKKDEAAERACIRYGYTCVAILLLSAWTPLPFYAAMALIAGLAVFPTVYVFRLYYPIDKN